MICMKMYVGRGPVLCLAGVVVERRLNVGLVGVLSSPVKNLVFELECMTMSV